MTTDAIDQLTDRIVTNQLLTLDDCLLILDTLDALPITPGTAITRAAIRSYGELIDKIANANQQLLEAILEEDPSVFTIRALELSMKLLSDLIAPFQEDAVHIPPSDILH